MDYGEENSVADYMWKDYDIRVGTITALQMLSTMGFHHAGEANHDVQSQFN